MQSTASLSIATFSVSTRCVWAPSSPGWPRCRCTTQLLVMACDGAERLTRALDSRPVIDQAIGIIRARTGVNTDDGFDRVRQISQSQNAKLHVVARQLVEEAVRRARARHSQT